MVETSTRNTARELRELARLALPLGVVQLGYQITSLVDTAFAGRIDETALGATGLGSSVFFVVTVVGVGIMLGLDPLAAQALGAGEHKKARGMLVQGLVAALMFTVPLSIIVVIATSFLDLFGVDPALAGTTAEYVYARLPSMCPLFLSVALRSYLQAAHLTRPILWATLWTNVFNAGANYILIFGDSGLVDIGLPAVGLPSFGVRGLGWASVIATAAQAATLVWAVRPRPLSDASNAKIRVVWPILWRIVAVGLPVGLHLLAEVGVFSAVQVLMGGIGVRATAAHQVAIIFASMTFSVCLGIGNATSVQVGRAIGRGDLSATRRVGLLGIGAGGLFMFIPAVAMWLVPEAIARFITDDQPVIEAAAHLLRIAAVFQIVDGIQTVAAGALRGAGETRFTFLAHLVAHWVIGLPAGMVLAFPLNMGPGGLWWGLTIGLAFVAVALSAKFVIISKRPIEPISNLETDSIPKAPDADQAAIAIPETDGPASEHWAPGHDVLERRPREQIRGLVVHRIEVSQEDPSFADNPQEVVRFFREHPVGREASGGQMPYPIVIDGSGTIHQMLPLSCVAPHAVRYNPSTVGVACIGDFRRHPPSSVQRRALVEVCAGLLRQLGLSSGSVHGHDELAGASRDANKECPGSALQMDQLRHEVDRQTAVRGDLPTFVW